MIQKVNILIANEVEMVQKIALHIMLYVVITHIDIRTFCVIDSWQNYLKCTSFYDNHFL